MSVQDVPHHGNLGTASAVEQGQTEVRIGGGD